LKQSVEYASNTETAEKYAEVVCAKQFFNWRFLSIVKWMWVWLGLWVGVRVG